MSLPLLLFHILEECTLKAQFINTIDPNLFRTEYFGEITIPWIPMKDSYESEPNCNHGAILKLSGHNHFMVACVPRLRTSRIFFYTYFFGVPEEAKKYHYTIEIQTCKDGPLIRKKAPVISASVIRFAVLLHPWKYSITLTS